MSGKIKIVTEQFTAEVELNDTPTASKILQAAPVKSTANTWGQEVYFDIGVECPLEPDARAEVEIVEVAYWTSGKALCVFFGATPASGPNGKPEAAGPVNVVGKVIGDAGQFASVKPGEKIGIEKA